MTTQTPYKTPECRLGAHDLCAGPRTVRLPGVQLPVETLLCDCSCHKRALVAAAPDAAGPKDPPSLPTSLSRARAMLAAGGGRGGTYP
ncbi:hypothetical protein J7I98_30590 [Streptomyces sp. ISL-98]|uniref:hypothetical protein n=1 Tax=Streptomyces sp. ISL-98 TaxID=2819192 RepID=UPI001BE9886B|nr:hypothetical protein [Streptomyces sp. ISL-98]MBT2510130.1 hypothetical protein [Streptomyces sp. ISL-98]